MKSVLKRGNVIMDNEIKNVFFDIEMLRRRLIRPFFIELGLTVGQGQPRILKELRQHGTMNQKELAGCLSYGCDHNVKNIRQNGKGWSVKERK